MDDILESYRILDIGPNASLEEVKRAYRELARVWHPDRFPNDVLLHQKAQEKLKQINIAYERIYGRGTHEPRRPTTSTRQSTSQQTRQSAPPPQWTPPQSQTSQSAPAKPKSTSWFWGPERSRVLWIWIFGVLAALYNPIFRVHLDRNTWTGVNWFTVGTIIVAAAAFWRPATKPTEGNQRWLDGIYHWIECLPAFPSDVE